jgi:hypothetical protein
MDLNFKNMEKNSAGPLDSREAVVAKDIAKYIQDGKVEIAGLTSDKEIEEALLKEGRIQRMLKTRGEISMPGVIGILRKIGVILPISTVVKEKPRSKVDFVPVEVPEGILSKPRVVSDKRLGENFHSYQKTEKIRKEKEEIISGSNDITDLYNEALKLEKVGGLESEEYYYEFTKRGFYSQAEVKKDFTDLKEREDEFRERERPEREKAKKIATMTEIALQYAVSGLKWYGKNVKIQPTSKFDDIKRGVDGILEILKKNEESNFMGLGIDVTFRGLYSEQFKEKFFSLLRTIESGHKTKVKYFKRHDGKFMKEFAVPKVILSLDLSDVKNLVYYLKNIKDQKIEDEFRNSDMRFEVMNQIIRQCSILSNFAKRHENNIYEEYTEAWLSIKALAQENPEIKTMIEVVHNDPMSRHLSNLMKEFEEEENKDGPANQKRVAA